MIGLRSDKNGKQNVDCSNTIKNLKFELWHSLIKKPTRPKSLRENQRGKKFRRKSDELWKVQWSQITNSLNVSLHFSGSRAPIMLPPTTTYNMWWEGEMAWKPDPTKTGKWRELAEILKAMNMSFTSVCLVLMSNLIPTQMMMRRKWPCPNAQRASPYGRGGKMPKQQLE